MKSQNILLYFIKIGKPNVRIWAVEHNNSITRPSMSLLKWREILYLNAKTKDPSKTSNCSSATHRSQVKHPKTFQIEEIIFWNCYWYTCAATPSRRTASRVNDSKEDEDAALSELLVGVLVEGGGGDPEEVLFPPKEPSKTCQSTLKQRKLYSVVLVYLDDHTQQKESPQRQYPSAFGSRRSSISAIVGVGLETDLTGSPVAWVMLIFNSLRRAVSFHRPHRHALSVLYSISSGLQHALGGLPVVFR